MTYAELQRKMSSAEFEIHMALAMLRQDECPSCGVEPKDLMEFGVNKVRCPVCKYEYGKVRRLGGSWKDDR